MQRNHSDREIERLIVTESTRRLARFSRVPVRSTLVEFSLACAYFEVGKKIARLKNLVSGFCDSLPRSS
ncbi:MAG: hypothetical protein NUW37_20305 [Planctomycetes bacterium]|nr:hypothetical protein [Planctomycetota bacterium]